MSAMKTRDYDEYQLGEEKVKNDLFAIRSLILTWLYHL